MASRGRKAATLCFVAYLLIQYIVIVADTLTRYEFSDPAAMRVSDVVRGPYDLAIMSTPNQLFTLMYHLPSAVILAILGALNAAVAVVLYLLIIKGQWRPWLIALCYLALRLLLWLLEFAYPWAAATARPRPEATPCSRPTAMTTAAAAPA